MLSALNIYSTREQSPLQQFDYWREELCHNFVELAAERKGPGLFAGRITHFPLRTPGVLRVTADAHCVSRTKAGIDRSSEDCFFANLQLSGTAKTRQRDTIVVTRAGDMVLVDTRHPFSVLHEEPFDLICFKIPYTVLSAGLSRHALASPLPVAPASNGYARILRSYAAALLEEAGSDLEGCSPLLTDQLVGLLAAAINSGTDIEPVGVLGEQRAGRVRAVQLFIDANLGDPNLSLSRAADHFELSPRYLQKLFAALGSTFSQTVAHRRLDKVAACLRRADLRGQSITETAFRHGFNDLSAFNRSFKKRFGNTPRQYRTLALGE